VIDWEGDRVPPRAKDEEREEAGWEVGDGGPDLC
jgi:hypothetical protein